MNVKSNQDIALLLVRVGLASVFIAHGVDKFMNIEGTIGFFGSLGLPLFMAYFIAFVEVIGGASMLIGIATGWSGLFLASTMIAAIALVKIKKGFLGGFEFELMLFLAALAISFAGPGKYALSRIWKKNE